MPTCEAACEDGQLEWIGDESEPGRHRVQVRILDSETKKQDRKDVRRMLECTQGAWGTDKTLEEEEVQQLRDEWDRLERDSFSEDFPR